jgi:hypothetical protein
MPVVDAIDREGVVVDEPLSAMRSITPLATYSVRGHTSARLRANLARIVNCLARNDN